MKSPRLVVVTGVDGSGKTTIARFLVRYLKSKGFRAQYVWIKSLHTLAFLISRLFEPLGWHRVLKNPNNIIVSRFELPDSPSHHKIWSFIEFVSILPWIILRVNLPIFLGFTIVSDRYLIDSVVSISMRVQDMFFANTFLGRLLLKMIAKETIVIHLDVDLYTILDRRPDIEYTIEEVQHQIALYRLLAKKIGAFTIYTAMLSVKETESKILNSLISSLIKLA